MTILDINNDADCDLIIAETSCIYKQTRISDNGNVIEVSTWHRAPQTHRMLFNTRGIGDRRARKAAAKAWIEGRRTAVFRILNHIPVNATGSITRFSGKITITV